jgi:hypothetical protein
MQVRIAVVLDRTESDNSCLHIVPDHVVDYCSVIIHSVFYKFSFLPFQQPFIQDERPSTVNHLFFASILHL